MGDVNSRDPPDKSIVIVGASARAAAFSALRAGFQPISADLFADSDLVACCRAIRVRTADYPDALQAVIATAPPRPWLYTGALENHADLVGRIAAQRPLWGNPPEVLRRVREPFAVATYLKRAGLPHAEVRRTNGDIPAGTHWLLKPIAGAGGRGVQEYSVLSTHYSARDINSRDDNGSIDDDLGIMPVLGADNSPVAATDALATMRGDYFLQQRIDGLSCSAVFVANGRRAALLGVTQQLVAVPEFHAKPFHYCGSIGPLPVARETWQGIARLGDVLAEHFQLIGLFGIDGILRDDVFWPVEINPRYTASVEVLELISGIPFIALHRDACVSRTIPQSAPSVAGDWSRQRQPQRVLGKAILFAPAALRVSELTARASELVAWSGRWPVPRLADIPHPGTEIAAGRPICTVFAAGDSVDECRRELFAAARTIYDHGCKFGMPIVAP